MLMIRPGCMTTAQRDMLIAHLDGVCIPLDIRSGAWRLTVKVLLGNELLKYDCPGGGRVQGTRITAKGREMLGMVLADYADALARAADFALDTNRCNRCWRPARRGHGCPYCDAPPPPPTGRAFL